MNLDHTSDRIKFSEETDGKSRDRERPSPRSFSWFDSASWRKTRTGEQEQSATRVRPWRQRACALITARQGVTGAPGSPDELQRNLGSVAPRGSDPREVVSIGPSPRDPGALLTRPGGMLILRRYVARVANALRQKGGQLANRRVSDIYTGTSQGNAW